MTLTVGIDVGGTKLAGSVVDEDGKIVAEVRWPTPGTSPRQIIADIVGAVTELAAGHDIAAVGVGAAGWIDAAGSVVLFAPNLAWRDEPLRDELAARLAVPVLVDNDANAMAWAEHRFGAGRGQDYLVAVTVGTGIGGGIVLDGKLYRGRFGVGAEMGHMRVVPLGRLCGCGNRGCWEQYCSGRALVREARHRAAVAPSTAQRLLELAGSVDGIQGRKVTQAARDGDPAAVATFEELGGWLGQGLADIAATLDPGCFVVGGGVGEAGDLLLGPARARYAQSLTGRGYRPMAEIRQAQLGNDAGMVGIADLVRQSLGGHLPVTGG